MQEGLRRAVAAPMSLAERVSLLWPPLKQMMVHGNPACRSDAQVGPTRVLPEEHRLTALVPR